jgi:hypothetical protein
MYLVLPAFREETVAAKQAVVQTEGVGVLLLINLLADKVRSASKLTMQRGAKPNPHLHKLHYSAPEPQSCRTCQITVYVLLRQYVYRICYKDVS